MLLSFVVFVVIVDIVFVHLLSANTFKCAVVITRMKTQCKMLII